MTDDAHTRMTHGVRIHNEASDDGHAIALHRPPRPARHCHFPPRQSYCTFGALTQGSISNVPVG